MSQAYWVQKTHLFKADEYICSRCSGSFEKRYKTCPNCGAIMGKTKYNPTWVDEAEGLSAILDEDW